MAYKMATTSRPPTAATITVETSGATSVSPKMATSFPLNPSTTAPVITGTCMGTRIYNPHQKSAEANDRL